MTVQLKDALIVDANTSEGVYASGADPITYRDTVWEDNQVNVGRVSFPGNADPTWRRYDHGVGGVDFDVLGFAVNDYINFEVQTYHSMELNSVLDCHMHFILPNTTDIGDKFQFELTVIAAGIHGTYAAPVGSPFVGEHTIVADDDVNHGLLQLAEIPASNTTVSSIYTVQFKRIAATTDEYGSEVYVKFIDCHYQLDTAGSKTESAK